MKKQIVIVLVVFFFLMNIGHLYAQFPPAAGMPGSTAIYKDSSIFVNWAKSCHISPGYINIVDTNISYAGSNRANYGFEADGLGVADNHVISLGDGGMATLSFNPSIRNGIGYDFAVFENGLNDDFLELAFVEVSSDSIHFVRFPATSLTQDSSQVNSFGYLDPEKLNNFASKYRVLYGTPFDLEDIKDSNNVDLEHIRYVRVVDVVGNISEPYASKDAFGHMVNDPWPTPWNTGGFDLDAIGVMNENAQAQESISGLKFRVFPNPVLTSFRIESDKPLDFSCSLYDSFGVVQWSGREISATENFDIRHLQPGVYVLVITSKSGEVHCLKVIKR